MNLQKALELMTTLQTNDYYFRVEGGVSFTEGSTTSTGSIYFREYRVLKETPHGVWLFMGYSKPKFVLKSTSLDEKRFAYGTREQAFNSFLRRKEAYKQRLTNLLAETNTLIRIGNQVWRNVAPLRSVDFRVTDGYPDTRVTITPTRTPSAPR